MPPSLGTLFLRLVGGYLMGACSLMAYEAIITLPGKRAMEHLAKNESITLKQAERLRAVSGHTPEAFRQNAAGAIMTKQWHQAQHAQQRYVSSVPRDSYGWLRLAFILRAAKKIHRAAQALERSFTTGRYERELMLPRLVEAAVLWNTLTPSIRAYALSDLMALWGRERRALLHTLPINQFWPLYRRAFFGTTDFKTVIALRSTPQTKQ